jgi:DNA-binding CsgD family transcriptional regulator
MTSSPAEETNRLLRIIIALLIRQESGEAVPLSLRERIQILSDLGLSPSEIAAVIGRSGNYVNKELTDIRKAAKAKK